MSVSLTVFKFNCYADCIEKIKLKTCLFYLFQRHVPTCRIKIITTVK